MHIRIVKERGLSICDDKKPTIIIRIKPKRVNLFTDPKLYKLSKTIVRIKTKANYVRKIFF